MVLPLKLLRRLKRVSEVISERNELRKSRDELASRLRALAAANIELSNKESSLNEILCNSLANYDLISRERDDLRRDLAQTSELHCSVLRERVDLQKAYDDLARTHDVVAQERDASARMRDEWARLHSAALLERANLEQARDDWARQYAALAQECDALRNDRDGRRWLVKDAKGINLLLDKESLVDLHVFYHDRWEQDRLEYLTDLIATLKSTRLDKTVYFRHRCIFRAILSSGQANVFRCSNVFI